jgi:NAD(P)-dependent dehydrogenase (short-subunit alcohol dehydrogenase family)
VIFRHQLLSGSRIAYAGAGDAPILSDHSRLGAWVEAIGPTAAAGEDALAAWVAERLPLSAVVVDAGPAFGAGGTERLTAALQEAWIVARAVAAGALIPARTGRLLFVTPRPDAGPHAGAARAGLENLARTLSVEWARLKITAVTLAPGAATSDDELTALASFLLSEAGGYFTGCRFDLGSVPSLAGLIPDS